MTAAAGEQSGLTPGAVRLEANAEEGDTTSTLDAAVDGTGLEIIVNMRYLTDVLSVIETPQAITVATLMCCHALTILAVLPSFSLAHTVLLRVSYVGANTGAQNMSETAPQSAKVAGANLNAGITPARRSKVRT